MLNPASPLGFLITVLNVRLDRTRSEKGASAVEWVIISAIVVAICIAVAGLLRAALEGKATDISNDIKKQ